MHKFCQSVSSSGGRTLVSGPRHLLFGSQKALAANAACLHTAAVALVTPPAQALHRMVFLGCHLHVQVALWI